MNELESRLEELIYEISDKSRSSLGAITRTPAMQTYLVEKILSVCNKIIQLNNDDTLLRYAKFIKAICYDKKKYWYQKVEILKELGYNDYWIYRQKNEETYKELIRYNLIKMGKNHAEIDEPFIQQCKAIYDCVFKVMDCLVVEDEKTEVSHYTSRKIAEVLLFEKSPIRMCSMATANDKSEGGVIFKFLDHHELFNKYFKGVKTHQCFITCFSFDPNCLNQFRLYGKENEKEATGVSLCFEASSFDISISNQLKFKKKQEFYEETIKSPLYRVLYINPDVIAIDKNKSIESVGHGGNEDESLKNSLKIIKKTMAVLQNEINEFFRLSKKNEESQKIVSNILYNLCFIVKSAAFKEEQECRLFSIQKLKGSSHIKFCKDLRKLYMDYNLPMKEIKKITFAPKVPEGEFLLFVDRLAQCVEYYYKDMEEDVLISCMKSDLPIS